LIDLKGYNWKGIGIVAGIVGIILLLIWIAVKQPKYKNEMIDYLNKQNDSLRFENELARERQIQNEKKVDSLFTEMKTIDREIIRTKEYYEKEKIILDTLNVYQLEQFFTDRYNQR
jgi:hypothetical protein